jgi:hypothetical protein
LVLPRGAALDTSREKRNACFALGNRRFVVPVHRELLRQRPARGEQPHARFDLFFPRIRFAAAERVFKRLPEKVHQMLAEPRGLLKRPLRDIPKVAAHVQNLVVAVQDVHRASRLSRLLVQFLEQN